MKITQASLHTFQHTYSDRPLPATNLSCILPKYQVLKGKVYCWEFVNNMQVQGFLAYELKKTTPKTQFMFIKKKSFSTAS